MTPSYDLERGLATYWPREEGPERRGRWCADVALPTFMAELHADPAIRSGLLLVAHNAGQYDRDGEVRVFLATSHLPEVSLDGLLENIHERGEWASHDAANHRDGHPWEPPITNWTDVMAPLFGAYLPGEDIDPKAIVIAGRFVRGEAWAVELETPQRPWMDGLRQLPPPRELMLTRSETERGRREILRDFVLPHVVDAFNAGPQLNSATLVIAQYWDDNAHDEVHMMLLLSELPTPDLLLPELTRSRALRHGSNIWWGSPDPVNHPSGAHYRSRLPDHPQGYLYPVPFFGAFCADGGDQNLEPWDCYVPYATFRRAPAGPPRIEVVGTMRRPWLDGVKLMYWD